MIAWNGHTPRARIASFFYDDCPIAAIEDFPWTGLSGDRPVKDGATQIFFLPCLRLADYGHAAGHATVARSVVPGAPRSCRLPARRTNRRLSLGRAGPFGFLRLSSRPVPCRRRRALPLFQRRIDESGRDGFHLHLVGLPLSGSTSDRPNKASAVAYNLNRCAGLIVEQTALIAGPSAREAGRYHIAGPAVAASHSVAANRDLGRVGTGKLPGGASYDRFNSTPEIWAPRARGRGRATFICADIGDPTSEIWAQCVKLS